MENDEERIEIAEKVLINIVNTMNQHGIQSIRDLVKGYIYESMIEGNILELLLPDSLLQALASIGIELDENETLCLLEVLAKQQLENQIMVDELESIMQNVQDVIDNGEDISQS